NWMQRLLAFPVQFIIGAAAVLNNTLGVLNGLHPPGVEREFKRTPKFRLMQSGEPPNGDHWTHSRYALRIDRVTWGEIALGVYAIIGVGLAADRLPTLILYMASYAVAFFVFAGWNIVQSAGIHRPQHNQRRLTRESSEIIRRA
ncbi:MAG: hypothetical protein JXA10_10830, partial [Anaerolineae bacterium]|nr:hypothetical protein [Anaerolineae bacterium]